MNNTFFYKNNTEISPDINEVERYLGYTKGAKPEEKVAQMIEKAALEMQILLKPQGIYEIFPVKIEDLTVKDEENYKNYLRTKCEKIAIFEKKSEEICQNSPNFDEKSSNLPNFDEKFLENVKKITFADTTIYSKNLGYNLKNSTEIALIAGTIGPQIDSYIRRATVMDSVYGAICQATGAMYIEQFMDLLNKEIVFQASLKNKKTCTRFSPGYGDVPLSTQKTFFTLLNCNRIGLTLMDTLIMAPEKSVTAFVGIKS